VKKLNSLKELMTNCQNDINIDIEKLIQSDPDRPKNYYSGQTTWYGILKKLGNDLESNKENINKKILYDWNYYILFYYKIEIIEWHDTKPFGTFEIITKEQIKTAIKE
jgi:hypothetical protein